MPKPKDSTTLTELEKQHCHQWPDILEIDANIVQKRCGRLTHLLYQKVINVLLVVYSDIEGTIKLGKNVSRLSRYDWFIHGISIQSKCVMSESFFFCTNEHVINPKTRLIGHPIREVGFFHCLWGNFF